MRGKIDGDLQCTFYMTVAVLRFVWKKGTVMTSRIAVMDGLLQRNRNVRKHGTALNGSRKRTREKIAAD